VPTQSANHGTPGSVRDIRTRQAAVSHYTQIGPNSEPQRQFFSTPADIALYGGAAGGGKTFALLMEAVRHIDTPGFASVFFRLTRPELTQDKGAWEKSEEIYYGLGGFPNRTDLRWYFAGGATVHFAAVANASEVRKRWGSAQVGGLFIDQAETFSEAMFWGLFARNRSTSGVRPYCRMGCNPDPDSWLAEFFAWWIDSDGYAIPERAGVLRWFVRVDNKVYWADRPEQLVLQFRRAGQRDVEPISVTFIPAKLSDNVDLERADPEYRRKLEAAPWQEKERLLGDPKKGGNWKVKLGAGMFPGPEGWILIPAYYPNNSAFVRYWDTAATAYGEDVSESDRGASTAGVLMAFDDDGPCVVDVVEVWTEGKERDDVIRQTAELDRDQWGSVTTWLEQEPGGAGKTDAAHNLKVLEGFDAYAERATGSKVIRARPWASAVQGRRVRVVKSPAWTKNYIEQHQSFPLSRRKDMVDASSGAYSKVLLTPRNDSTGIVSGTNTKRFVDQFAPGTFG
jgi:phage terminase large subunit-like protein